MLYSFIPFQHLLILWGFLLTKKLGYAIVPCSRKKHLSNNCFPKPERSRSKNLKSIGVDLNYVRPDLGAVSRKIKIKSRSRYHLSYVYSCRLHVIECSLWPLLTLCNTRMIKFCKTWAIPIFTLLLCFSVSRRIKKYRLYSNKH